MYQTIMKIDGMMCGMCEAHVNDAIRKAIPEASKVKSSHSKGESRFITEQEPDQAKLAEAIAQTGYTLLSVKCEPYQKKLVPWGRG